jgi:hypothetical protein
MAVLDPRVDASLNLDGLQRGGPFSASPDPELPEKPFMFLTKEEALPARLTALLESLPTRGYLITVHGATHDSFTDGPLLVPSLLPLPNQADAVLDATREYMLAFLVQELRGGGGERMKEADSARVTVRFLGPDQ